jgi:hypothetical protein
MKTFVLSTHALVASAAALLLAFSSLPGAEATTLVRHVSAVIGSWQMAMHSTRVHSQTFSPGRPVWILCRHPMLQQLTHGWWDQICC